MLPLHAGGDLDPRHVHAVDGHLQGCLTCFREFREYASLRVQLGVLAEEPLPEGILDGFTEDVMARVEIGEPGPAAEAPGPAVLRWPVLPRLAAAAAVLLVAFAGWRYMDDGALTPEQRSLTGRVNRVVDQQSVASPALAPFIAPRATFRQFAPTLDVPAGAQGLVPPSDEELAVIRSGGDAGVLLIIQQGGGGGLQADPDGPAPRERDR